MNMGKSLLQHRFYFLLHSITTRHSQKERHTISCKQWKRAHIVNCTTPDQRLILYSYVILAATSTFFLNLAHVQNTGKYRKPAAIDYPNAYATAQQAKEDPKGKFAPFSPSPDTSVRTSFPSFLPQTPQYNIGSLHLAYAFNCAQRSHANFTEHQTSAVVSLLIAGLQFPIAAAVCGFGWTISRALYMVGYTTGSPETKGRGRYRGSAFWFCEVGLMGMAAYTGIKMVMGN